MAVQIAQMRPITPFEPVSAALGGLQQSANIQQELAKAEFEKMRATNPMMRGLIGPAAQAQSLNYLRDIYGENSPQYQMAKRAWDLEQKNIESRIGYQGALTASMPERYVTPVGRSFIEEERVRRGLAPTGQAWAYGQPSPELGTAAERGEEYGLKRQKEVSDTQARQRNLFATNIEKTLGQINPDDLVKYSGVVGTGKGGYEAAKSAFGMSSPEYKAYQKSSQNAKLLAKQVRQFYGDSIQPEMERKLSDLSNPSTWARDPQLAKELFLEFKNILGMEMETYRGALKSKKTFQDLEPTPKGGGKAMQDVDPLGIL